MHISSKHLFITSILIKHIICAYKTYGKQSHLSQVHLILHFEPVIGIDSKVLKQVLSASGGKKAIFQVIVIIQSILY